MKNVILMLVLNISVLFSQNIIDPPVLQLDSSYSSTSVYNTQFDGFVKGWNGWNISGKLGDALSIKFYETKGGTEDTYNYSTNINMIQGFAGFVNSAWGNKTFCAPGFNFEPTIKVDSTYNFKPKYKDNSGSVFGFLTRNFGDTIAYDTDSVHYHKLYFDKTKMGAVAETLALADSWPDYEFRDNAGQSNNDRNGRRWYLTLNIEPDENIAGIPVNYSDSTIFIVKMPYYSVGDTSKQYIVFDQTPREYMGVGDTVSIFGQLNDFRGKTRNLKNDTTTEFIITGKMLRLDTLGIKNHPITLSAHFYCDTLGSIMPIARRNKLLNDGPFQTGNSDRIWKLGIEITYHKSINVYLDWVRVQTPQLKWVMEGRYDLTARNAFNDTINHIHNNNPKKRIYRFEIFDEPNCSFASAQRYANKLLNGLVIVELQDNFKHLYTYSTEMKDLWSGFNITNNWSSTAAPYFLETTKRMTWDSDTNYHFTKDSLFDYSIGRKGYNVDSNANNPYYIGDMYNSAYESFFVGNYWGGPNGWNLIDTIMALPIHRNPAVFDSLRNFFPGYRNYSPLVALEGSLYLNFYKYPGYLFDDKNWWPNIWIQTHWQFDNPKKNLWTSRPFTGEEARLKILTQIILGAKGLVYYSGGSPTWPNLSTDMGIAAYTGPDSLLPTGINLINSSLIEDDFIRFPGDPAGLDTQLVVSNIRWDLLGHDSSRIYTGLRSIRREIYKIHKWIDACEPDLMRLKLVSWYAKGFTKWYLQDPKITTDTLIMRQLIDIDSGQIKSRKIYDPRANTFDTPFQSDDSLFMDITMLRDSADHNLTSNVRYIALVNRRTDPLIACTAQIKGQINDTLKFISTAELEDSCGISLDTTKYPQGVDASVRMSYWRSMWWRRNGAREYHIPFRLRNIPNTNQYTILKITELGAHDSLLNSQPWRQEPFAHIIDTTLAADSTLIVKLLPGDSKFLKIQIFNTDTLKGILDFSNQRKLISYPIKQSSIDAFGDNDSVRYHLVYHKPNYNGNMRVYYRRSHPMVRSANFNQIDWETNEHEIADSINLGNLPNEMGYASNWLNAAYPTIVVRYDTTVQIPKVYVAYSFNFLNGLGERTDYYIGENIFPANDPAVDVGTANAIYHGNGKVLEHWGTPTINGSYPGNYYGFGDSLDGIVAGWKNPNSTYFTNYNTHLTKLRWNFDSYYHPSHPSLNSYSRIRLHEDDCALVFQDSISDPLMMQVRIEYTRLRMVDDTIRNYLPNYFTNIPPIIIDPTATFANMSTYYGGEYNHTLPVVYRGVEDGNFSQSGDSLELLIKHRDMVYWQIDNWSNYDGRILGMRALNIVDTIVNGIVNPAGWQVGSQYWIESLSKSLSHPTVSQGAAKSQQLNFNMTEILGDSNVIINFKSLVADTSGGTPQNIVGNIWHLPHGYTSLYPQNNNGMTVDTLLELLPNAKRITFRGKTPQLAALPYTHWSDDWYYDRRVFNTDDNIPPSMIASIEYFARKTVEDEETANVFMGYMSERGKQLFTPIRISDLTGLKYEPAMHSFKKSGNQFIPSDTITTSWFEIGKLNTAHFFTNGDANLNTVMQIERQGDGKNVVLPNAIAPDNKIMKNRFFLINGGNHKYRIKLIKIDTAAQYTESLIIANMPTDDELDASFDSSRFGKTIAYENKQLIDLGEESYQDGNSNKIKLIIYPNPAHNSINVLTYLPLSSYMDENRVNKDRQIVIKAYSSVGKELYNQVVKPGEIVKIPTNLYSQGVYFIRAEEKISGWDIEPLTPAIEPFVIER